MKNNTLSTFELNAIMRTMPLDDNHKLPPAKNWKKIDIGKTETYVGDNLYVVALVEKLPRDMKEVETNGMSTEKVVIKYLRGEGFIGDEYFYVGMQRFDVKNPPNDLMCGEQ